MKTRKITLGLSTFLISLILSATTAFAQQEAMFTQYMFNTMALNPAYAGSRNVISATALYRSQWTGMDGAPETTTFTIDAPISNKRVGLGLQVFSDKLGITATNGAVATYAYRIRMDKASLSFGLQGSVSQYKADYTRARLEPSGPSYDNAFSSDVNTVLFNFGTGVYYNSDKFYLGLSSPQLLANALPGNKDYQSKLNKQHFHLFFMSGYVFNLDEDFKLKPSVLIKGVKGAPVEGDANLNLWIKNTFSIGASYRTNADIAGLFELQATPQIRIGYAYDHSITNLKSVNSGGHEIMLRYEFGLDKNKVLSPRYF
ncbi:PorP/SprF family type IX secretion system membrane protein [Desertivirga xinjiangensis]|uniref:PorP/SprF family type IX secretion system membrane protein n=1 Tax=Desertivirga xinjiangensis TaxID=539206 RepID=UPI0021088BA3|nr:type IX secretion system membrane protein PorP/SprF [Pedobacter xinjiangensis]